MARKRRRRSRGLSGGGTRERRQYRRSLDTRSDKDIQADRWKLQNVRSTPPDLMRFIFLMRQAISAEKDRNNRFWEFEFCHGMDAARNALIRIKRTGSVDYETQQRAAAAFDRVMSKHFDKCGIDYQKGIQR